MKQIISLVFLVILTLACLKAEHKMLKVNCTKINLNIENKLCETIESLIVNDIELGDLPKSSSTTVCLESALSYNADSINHLFLGGIYMGSKINPVRYFCGTGLLTIEEGEYNISIIDTINQRFIYE